MVAAPRVASAPTVLASAAIAIAGLIIAALLGIGDTAPDDKSNVREIARTIGREIRGELSAADTEQLARQTDDAELAEAFAGIAERLTAEEGEPVLRLYLLVTGALRALAAKERDPSLVLLYWLPRFGVWAGPDGRPVGNVTSIEQVKVNNNGDTLVEVDTDGATTSAPARPWAPRNAAFTSPLTMPLQFLWLVPV